MTESSSTSMFDERIKLVEDAIKNEDWFLAFTNIVVYFEFYGYWAIRNHCTKEKIDLSKKVEASLKRQGAVNIALLLRIIGLINNEEYSKIRNVIAERNKIVHPSQKGIWYLENKEKTEAKKVLNEAISCLKSFWNKRAWMF